LFLWLVVTVAVALNCLSYGSRIIGVCSHLKSKLYGVNVA